MATIVVGSRVSVTGLGDGVVRYIGYHKVSSLLFASNSSRKKYHKQKERPSDPGTNIIPLFPCCTEKVVGGTRVGVELDSETPNGHSGSVQGTK